MYSKELLYVFSIGNVQYIWKEFRDLGFDTKHLAKEFWESYYKNGGNGSYSSYFLKYGMEVFNPMLNKHFDRPMDYPSFPKLMEVALDHLIQQTKHIHLKQSAD